MGSESNVLKGKSHEFLDYMFSLIPLTPLDEELLSKRCSTVSDMRKINRRYVKPDFGRLRFLKTMSTRPEMIESTVSATLYAVANTSQLVRAALRV